MNAVLTATPLNSADSLGAVPRRRVQLFVFNPWAGRLQDGAEYLRELPTLEVSVFA